MLIKIFFSCIKFVIPFYIIDITLCVVILMAAPLAASRTLRLSAHWDSNLWTFSDRALASSRLDGLARPLVESASTAVSHGINSLIPKNVQNCITDKVMMKHNFHSQSFFIHLSYIQPSIWHPHWSCHIPSWLSPEVPQHIYWFCWVHLCEPGHQLVPFLLK